MKPRPTKIQPGATHWNPDAGPDWYTNKGRSDGGWMYFEGNWGQGTWRWSERVSALVLVRDLIPVEHLMAQHNGANSLSAETTQAVSENYTARLKREMGWNGEGLPPFGVDCEITTKTILGAVEYEGIGMFIAQTMDYYVMLMQSDRTPWIRSKDRVTFRPLKTEREKAIAAMSKVISEACDVDDLDPVESRKQLGALYDKGYRRGMGDE